MAQVKTPFGNMEGKLIFWDGYGIDEREKGEKKKDQDGNPQKKKESNANQGVTEEVAQSGGDKPIFGYSADLTLALGPIGDNFEI